MVYQSHTMIARRRSSMMLREKICTTHRSPREKFSVLGSQFSVGGLFWELTTGNWEPFAVRVRFILSLLQCIYFLRVWCFVDTLPLRINSWWILHCAADLLRYSESVGPGFCFCWERIAGTRTETDFFNVVSSSKLFCKCRDVTSDMKNT